MLNINSKYCVVHSFRCFRHLLEIVEKPPKYNLWFNICKYSSKLCETCVKDMKVGHDKLSLSSSHLRSLYSKFLRFTLDGVYFLLA